jgi:transcription factor C subunit 3
VSIGDNGRYNKTPLAQVESEFPGYVDYSAIGGQPPAEPEPGLGGSHQASATVEEKPKNRRTRAAEGPRIRLKEERLYQAICGHPPDARRVAPLEFALLTHITATKSDGILQGELIRLSGQDKRSVPKRTDALHNKGYIIKETVFYRGLRTSRLTLKKFARPHAVGGDTSQGYGTMLRHVVRRIFDILASQNLIPQSRLAEELSLQSPTKSAVLQKIIRRLEKLKLVKRVRTAVGPSATSGDLQQFVQLLRHAKPEDLENFNTEQLSLDQTLEELSGNLEYLPGISPAESPTAAEDEEDLQMPPKAAAWNPDRLMSNMLVEAVQSAGRHGLSNSVCH